MVSQISVFVENKPGKLYNVVSNLNKNKINIRALSIADTSDFGILRLIVDKPAEAKQQLTELGHIVKSTDVLAVEMKDEPGGLEYVLSCIKDAGVVIEYMYAFVGKAAGGAVLILRLDNMEKGENALKEGNVKLLSCEQVYSI